MKSHPRIMPRRSGPVAASAAFLLSLLAPYALVASAGGDVEGLQEAREVVSASEGANITLRCPYPSSHVEGKDGSGVLWVWDSLQDEGARFDHSDGGNTLHISSLRPSDQKVYTCQDAENNESLHTVFVKVRTVPPAVANLTVNTNSVFATVVWGVPGDGGSPITGFQLYYRRDKSHLSPREEEELFKEPEVERTYQWTFVSGILPNASSHTVLGLAPNSTYYFRMCALNALGCGRNVSVAADTKFNPEEVDAAKEELRRARQEEEDEESNNEISALKIWIVGIGVLLITFAVLGLGISLLLLRNCDQVKRKNSCETTEEEAMELVPHITLNPSFNIDMLEYLEPNAGASSSSGNNSNEDAIVDIVRRSGQHQNQRRLVDEEDLDEELNTLNSPIHRLQKQKFGGSNGSINRPNG